MVFWWRSAPWRAWSPASSSPATTTFRSPPGSGISCTRTPPPLPSPLFSSHSALCWPPQSSDGCYAGYSAAWGWVGPTALLGEPAVCSRDTFWWHWASLPWPRFFPGSHGSISRNSCHTSSPGLTEVLLCCLGTWALEFSPDYTRSRTSPDAKHLDWDSITEPVVVNKRPALRFGPQPRKRTL